MAPMRADLARAARGASSAEDARRAIQKVLDEWADRDDIANAVFVPRVLGDLAGRLAVREHEAAADRIGSLTDGQPLDSFLNLPWEDALDYFRGRGLTSEEELSTLIRGHASLSEAARKDMLDQVQKRVNAMLAESVESGGSFAEFAARIEDEAEGLGITNQNAGYLDTVFRTSVLDAYGGGRVKAMNDPDVVAARPYRKINTAGDGRVRSQHAPLDGLVYRSDGPLADLHAPFSYRCRCTITTLGPDYDGPVVDSLPPGSVEPGFGGI